MDVNSTKSITVNNTNNNISLSKTSNNDDSKVSFACELNSAKKSEETNKTDKQQEKDEKLAQEKIDEKEAVQESKNTDEQKEFVKDSSNTEQSETVDDAIGVLNTVLDELNKLNQKDELSEEAVKETGLYADKKDNESDKDKDNIVLDNNINIPEQTDKINLQMGSNMEFNSNGQPFSDFMNEQKSNEVLKSSVKELAEEKAILSTMEENIAIANKNMALSKTKTVENEHGVHKYDNKTNLIVDTIVSYENVVMDKADVDFFANLVEKGVVNMSEVQGAEKSSRVSKTLADMLAKAMNENKPVRIDFDNNISVIIKIDRAGKISADFLPSSQVAEAYLRENLPLLRQRFDDNNIDYNELTQRKQKQENPEDNKKKGRKDE